MSFRKINPALWTTYGLLDRRKSNDLSDFCYEYIQTERQSITHDSYAIVLMPTKKILHHFPIGYHISVTGCKDGTNGILIVTFNKV